MPLLSSDPSDSASIISDDSSLYSPEPASEETDLDAYLAYADRLPANMAHAAQTAASLAPERERHNPLEGKPSCWQLRESAADFVARLPPSSSLEVDVGSWIWISNPYAPPDDKPRNLDGFLSVGRKLLDDYLEAHGGRAPVGRGANGKIEKLKRDIKDAARTHHVTCGKWMLFPSEERVDEIWKTVCEAMIRGDLGVQAKVATKSGDGIGGEGRLICLYTPDFEDEADVLRVVRQLKELGLVSERGIWYKADAYTYLDITSKNSYGLKASLYGSKDMLGGGQSGSKEWLGKR